MIYLHYALGLIEFRRCYSSRSSLRRRDGEVTSLCLVYQAVSGNHLLHFRGLTVLEQFYEPSVGSVQTGMHSSLTID
jgi:hypothetical protein